MTHFEPTTIGLTIDRMDVPGGRIQLRVRPRKRPPDGAGILVYGPLLGGALIALVVLAVRFLLRVAG